MTFWVLRKSLAQIGSILYLLWPKYFPTFLPEAQPVIQKQISIMWLRCYDPYYVPITKYL